MGEWDRVAGDRESDSDHTRHLFSLFVGHFFPEMLSSAARAPRKQYEMEECDGPVFDRSFRRIALFFDLYIFTLLELPAFLHRRELNGLRCLV